MGNAKLLWGGIISGQAALAALMLGGPAWLRLSAFLVFHALSSTCFAFLLTMAVPSKMVTRRSLSLALFFSFTFFIPFFGAIGMLCSLFYFRHIMNWGERTEFFTVPIPNYMDEGDYSFPGMGEGGAWSRLGNTSIPQDKRLKALLAVGNMPGANSSRLLQRATSDSDDEIRLLAFSLYDQREKVISRSITDAIHDIKETSDSDIRTSLCRKLAFSYWELVYNELAADTLRDFYIDQALHYAAEAISTGGNDPALSTLLGRIYLAKGETGKAEAAVNEALLLGAPKDRVLPYLAELAYTRREFSKLRKLFTKDPYLRYKPGIGHLARFWQDKA